jgi:hypothetical protein
MASLWILKYLVLKFFLKNSISSLVFSLHKCTSGIYFKFEFNNSLKKSLCFSIGTVVKKTQASVIPNFLISSSLFKKEE